MVRRCIMLVDFGRKLSAAAPADDIPDICVDYCSCNVCRGIILEV